MPEARFDPLGRRWIVLAPERARRGLPPMEPDVPDPAPCDFCGGQEDRTPPEVDAWRTPDGERWLVRVVPNLYPATAHHEVVVHTPGHVARFEDLPADHRAAIWDVYARRLQAVPTAENIVVWNRGRRAGASRTHGHGQIFGLDRPPPVLERERSAFEGDCILCDYAGRDELHVAPGVVANPVPLVAHELLVVAAHRPALDGSMAEAASVATASAIRSLRALTGDGVPFNLVMHASPGIESFHWHAHIYPRLATWGGLEVGAELPIVAADPLDTAHRLRAL